MTLDSRYEIVRSLLKKTQEEKIEWEVGPLTDSFYCKVGEHSVAIRLIRDDYFLVLHNADGEEIEEISDPEFRNAGYGDAFRVMGDLYIAARRNALGTEKIVNDILSQLEQK
ncbi:hypothetical protein [Agrobacterium cavarae]|uniref:hypothetical protein n=1 Tax=Agrobacterium cavarae TaxID=2528239 RepID=UPI002FDB0D08